jgi:hypothetical protein
MATVLSMRIRVTVVAVAVAAMCAPPALALAAAHHHVSPPARGVFHLVKSQPDGQESRAAMAIGKGGRVIKTLSIKPVKRCAGKSITMLGKQKIRKAGGVYYVGESSTSTVIVNVKQGGVESQAGLIVDFTGKTAASVLLSADSTTGNCTFEFAMKKR